MSCSDSDDVTNQTIDGDTTAPDDTAPNDVADRDGSYILLEVTYPSGNTVTYDHEVFDNEISFGSQHIGAAVALTVEKKLSTPFAIINMNFGFVVGSNDYPVTIEDVGLWPFTKASSELPPSMKIITSDGPGPQFIFSSWVDGASGEFQITRWGTAPGDVIEGAVQGTLKNDGPVDANAQITGVFRVFLPQKT